MHSDGKEPKVRAGPVGEAGHKLVARDGIRLSLLPLLHIGSFLSCRRYMLALLFLGCERAAEADCGPNLPQHDVLIAYRLRYPYVVSLTLFQRH